MSVRLVPTDDGWWCVTSGKAAHLPPEAAVDGVLVSEARSVLDQHGFFTPQTRRFAVTVLTATSCNLGCAYCFQNTDQSDANPYAPPRIARYTLTHKTVEKISRFVQQRMAALHFDSLSLMLFGGEPLLNPQGCLGLLRALQSVGLDNAEMISNTVLLRPRLASQLYDAGLRRIQVTFDGARERHNDIRVDRRGGATYDRILANIRDAAAATELQWHFRVNVSHHNIASLDRLIDDLASIPLPAPASLHLALIDDVGIGYDNQVSYSTTLTGRFIELITRAMDSGLTVPVMGNSLKDCPFCGGFAGETGAVINADGTLYSCWETAGRPEWSVGTLDGGYYSKEVIKDRWVACDYATASHGDKASTTDFYNTLDAFILERTHRPQRSYRSPATV